MSTLTGERGGGGGVVWGCVGWDGGGVCVRVVVVVVSEDAFKGVYGVIVG